MSYKTRKAIAAILFILAGAICLYCIYRLVAAGCTSIKAWMEVAVQIIVIVSYAIVDFSPGRAARDGKTGKRHLVWGFRNLANSLMALYLTILLTTAVLDLIDPGTQLWDTLLIVNLCLLPGVIALFVFSGNKKNKSNEQ